MTTELITTIPKLPQKTKNEIKKHFCSFLDVICTSTNRATFYNTKDEQENAVIKAHKKIFDLDRGLYAATLMLPGVTDFARQVGISKILSTAWKEDQVALVTPEVEFQILEWILKELPPQRILKLFQKFTGEVEMGQRMGSINNQRSRRLVLKYFINHKSFDFWAVKYRKKMREVFVHMINRRMSSILKAILAKDKSKWNKNEKSIIYNQISRFIHTSETNPNKVINAVSFVLGNKVDDGIFKKFEDAKEDLSKGEGLPLEVLEGIKSLYHKNVKMDKVLELSKSTMSAKKKMQVQKRAEKADVKIEFDPTAQDAVSLYIYAFENPKSKKREIKAALAEKAKKTALQLPMKYKNIGVVVDTSESMRGHKTQAMRPLAISLATRDVFCELASEKAVVLCSNGNPSSVGDVVFPDGDTELSTSLLKILKENNDLDAVFIISDGYENAPSGRLSEVIYLLRERCGVEIPIFHVSPVLASEAQGAKKLSEGLTVLPVSNPGTLGLPLLKGMIEADVENGIKALLNLTIPFLGKGD